MSRFFVFSHSKVSGGAKKLRLALPAKGIKHERSRFRGRHSRIIVNWGSSHLPEATQGSPVINRPRAVETSTNKQGFFDQCKSRGLEDIIPEFTNSIHVARDWLRAGKKVVGRQILRGSGGRGILIFENEQDLVHCPLYVLYVPKKDEYRIHIFNNNIVDVQRKARRRDVPDSQVDWQVRNHGKGFVFVRSDCNPPPCVLDASLQAFRATQLAFGAVDVIYNHKKGKAYVLEVNTAPGLEGQTVATYTQAIRDYTRRNF